MNLLQELIELDAKFEGSVKAQILYENATSARSKKKPEPCTEIAFLTTDVGPEFLLGVSDKLGVVLWIDKTKLEAWKKAHEGQEVGQ
jgi:hypothetical protein